MTTYVYPPERSQQVLGAPQVLRNSQVVLGYLG
jgi:hypothetical protein